MLGNVSVETCFVNSEEVTVAHFSLAVSHQQQQKVPVREKYIFNYLEDRSGQNSEFLGTSHDLVRVCLQRLCVKSSG